MKIVLVLIALLFLIAMYAVGSIHKRHFKAADGSLRAAPHIEFPGMATSYHPEHTIELKQYAGSGIKGVTAELDGVKNPEIEASMVLKAIGFADDSYELRRQEDGHFILYKPAKQERYFTFHAFYQVWWSSPAAL